uniref:RING-type domain-containing protein n=1 Tax=Biomphalaria glabrata TaxID=6526 RepID=A0A2C9K4A1_BIOGL
MTCDGDGPCRCMMNDGSGVVDISTLGFQNGSARRKPFVVSVFHPRQLSPMLSQSNAKSKVSTIELICIVFQQVLSIDRSFFGGLGFGLTACDPSTVDPGSLPDDSDLLLDRLEYWVVNKDICRNPEIGDELSFHLTESGEVRYARNNQAPVTLMHVDRTLPLWAFFDVYGNIQKIRVIGTIMAQIQGRLPRSVSMNSYNSSPGNSGAAYSAGLTVAMPPPPPHSSPASLPANVFRSNSVPVQYHSPAETEGDLFRNQQTTSLPATPLEDGASDCKVCWEKSINSVLYTCGHMCLCFDCATTIRNEKGLCPICRQTIQDVIKIYRS